MFIYIYIGAAEQVYLSKGAHSGGLEIPYNKLQLWKQKFSFGFNSLFLQVVLFSDVQHAQVIWEVQCGHSLN